MHQVQSRSGSEAADAVGVAAGVDGLLMVGRIVTEGCEPCQPAWEASQVARAKKFFRTASH
ncbi:MAG: hypothetical protein LZF86_110786 [Nitrospira sp.]|nr:MAG: hypothetical protein LZF86_110786 [Nitrospira sp.]